MDRRVITGALLRTAIWIKGRSVRRSFDLATKDPGAAQEKLLAKIVQQNRNTEYGRQHGFARITDGDTFADAVGINTFEEFVPYVERMKAGGKNILTAEQPLAFNLTSGTTDKPKFVPLTPTGQSLAARVSVQWLSRALMDHPSFLDRSIFTVAGSPVEGRTSGGIPYGSASGMIQKTLPRVVQGSFALPAVLSEVGDYELRYYLMARLGLEKDVSFIATPNPTTLVKIAETGIHNQEEIVRSVHDGVVSTMFSIKSKDTAVVEAIGRRHPPNRPRARQLEEVIRQHGKLLPWACWANLKLVGCWLGGSIGFQADQLSEYYGESTPKRDIGYLASECSINIMYCDNTPGGILALENAYYEFLPDGEDASRRLLRCHELEVGKRYKIILTNWNGLYRYDIHDLIEVCDFYNKTPVVAFVRKTEDMLNITGEKLHVNHFLQTFRRLEEEHSVRIPTFRVVPDYVATRYDILVAMESGPSKEFLKDKVLPFIDRCLCDANIEYDSKRKSGRLGAPRLQVMLPSWAEDARREAIEGGYRDAQFKWRMMATEMSRVDTDHIAYVVSV